ncbi:hypothetical protein E2I00_019401, partial [Balaenoptera physalus]
MLSDLPDCPGEVVGLGWTNCSVSALTGVLGTAALCLRSREGMSHEPKSPSLGMLSTATRTTATVNPLTPSPLNGALVPSGSPATSSALSAQAAPSSSFAAALRKLAKQAEEPRGPSRRLCGRPALSSAPGSMSVPGWGTWRMDDSYCLSALRSPFYPIPTPGSLPPLHPSAMHLHLSGVRYPPELSHSSLAALHSERMSSLSAERSAPPPGYYYDLDDSYDESDEEEVRAHLRCVAEQPPLKLDTSSEVSGARRCDKERLVALLQAVKQKALSAAAADPLRNSPRDSPAGSLSEPATQQASLDTEKPVGITASLSDVQKATEPGRLEQLRPQERVQEPAPASGEKARPSETTGGKKSLSMLHYIRGPAPKDIPVPLSHGINGKSKPWEPFVAEEFAHQFHESVLQSTQKALQKHREEEEDDDGEEEDEDAPRRKWHGIEAIFEAYQEHVEEQNLERQVLQTQCRRLEAQHYSLSLTAEQLSHSMA